MPGPAPLVGYWAASMFDTSCSAADRADLEQALARQAVRLLENDRGEPVIVWASVQVLRNRLNPATAMLRVGVWSS